MQEAPLVQPLPRKDDPVGDVGLAAGKDIKSRRIVLRISLPHPVDENLFGALKLPDGTTKDQWFFQLNFPALELAINEHPIGNRVDGCARVHHDLQNDFLSLPLMQNSKPSLYILFFGFLRFLFFYRLE